MIRIGQVLGSAAGIAMLAIFFLKLAPPEAKAVGMVQTMALVIAAFALGVGAISLFISHGKKVLKGHADAPYSAVLLASLTLMVLAGAVFGKPSDKFYTFMFKNFNNTLDSSFFAMLCFYIFSAAYRAFRIRNSDAAVFLISGTLVMLGAVPIGAVIWSKFPDISTWILSVPNTAAMRGILLGAALGYIATAMRIILGMEKGMFGGGGSGNS
ncbi:MAG: hypothetical protein M0Z94_06925 [Dehalococcoidales bacterium]|nr:hypothetical protein [Dehalococcoidales bacterium]